MPLAGFRIQGTRHPGIVGVHDGRPPPPVSRLACAHADRPSSGDYSYTPILGPFPASQLLRIYTPGTSSDPLKRARSTFAKPQPSSPALLARAGRTGRASVLRPPRLQLPWPTTLELAFRFPRRPRPGSPGPRPPARISPMRAALPGCQARRGVLPVHAARRAPAAGRSSCRGHRCAFVGEGTAATSTAPGRDTPPPECVGFANSARCWVGAVPPGGKWQGSCGIREQRTYARARV
ncbi:hypothetical protein C8Q79DRAFT_93012 [Trametes meyenii]|nr:hypothetical protein C8Q79DRAFT_93012 [Trametes meyenii]